MVENLDIYECRVNLGYPVGYSTWDFIYIRMELVIGYPGF